ncbi:hypothetical protein [Amycolatopsis cihanbeyliensis]|uniref:hypothetical protein n=1 Tax=Amycolatopsis cihanbeyliensis TaxID=1128664 RepID=UPI00114F1DC4|nr:hypothetical protein [Amycolatopsis cihanbeyliensis]
MAAVVGLATVLCLVLTGCGRQSPEAGPADGQEARRVPGSTTSGAPSQERLHRERATTEWVDGYCTAVGALVDSMSSIPEIDPSSPRRASRTSSRLLGAVIGGLDRTLSNLNGLAPAPVPSGDTMKVKAVADYTRIRERAVSAKEQLDAAGRDDARHAAIEAVDGPLEDLGEVNLLEGIGSTPELAAASRRAATCRELIEQDPSPRLGPA